VVINENLTGVYKAFIDRSESRVAGISARQVIGFDRRHIGAVGNRVWGLGW